jgi:4-amino-4-deoxy-L-arabinose transferase-like glycosyltransferase
MIDFKEPVSKWRVSIFLVVLLGLLLRFFRLKENLVFGGELGYDYLAIKNIVENARIPLLGPPSSHAWINMSPLYYWLLTPLFYVFDFNPTVGAYFMATAGASAIVINYFVIEKLFNKKAAIISSFLIAISPAWISLAREARFFSLIPVLFYPFIYFLTVGIRGSGKHLFWAGFFLGVILNFHLASIVLIPATLLLFYIKKKDITIKSLKMAFTGLLIPSLPFLVYNLMHKFEPIIKLSLWIPYRMLGFVGLYPKNVADLPTITSNINSLITLFNTSYVASGTVLGPLLFLVIIVYVGIKTIRASKKKLNWTVLLTVFSVSYLGIFLHGNPPIHYYMPIFAFPVIFLSLFLAEIWNKKGKYLVLMLLALLTFVNFSYFFSEKWFYQPKDKMVGLLVPYNLQLKTARSIIADVNWKDYSFSRVGPFDYYEGDYAQNYRYLMWWLGNEPVEKANAHYIIYEGKDFFPDNEDENIIFKSTDILVIKEKS